MKIKISIDLKIICFLINVVFVILKLCKVINWNWWLVFLPLIIYAVVYCLSIIIIYFFTKI